MERPGRRIWQAVAFLLALSAVGAADTTQMPPPGTLNYVEGQVSVEGQKQTPKSVGTTYLEPNQVLDTGNGNAEMLLTPGVYMRVGANSEVKMISPGLADTRVQLDSGSAMVEVDELFKENNVSVVVGDATTRLEKNGLYDFHANPASVRVLDGKAMVFEGDQQIKLTKGRETLLTEAQPLSKEKYNKQLVEEDPLYRWSKLRSEYASESNVETANALLMYGGWYGPGWYWDPFWWDFAFMPGDGMFWGPFGGAFFSPWWVGMAPYYGYYGGYRSYYHYPATAAKSGQVAPPLARSVAPAGAAGLKGVSRPMALRGMAPRAMAMPRMRMMRMAAPRMGGMGGFHGGMGGFRGGFGRGR
ncbi:MAG TPA: hypothetical protein VFD30_10885 [Terriglobia bacterium]|nr:hypothetical protein [Terriglobia bacterium]